MDPVLMGVLASIGFTTCAAGALFALAYITALIETRKERTRP